MLRTMHWLLLNNALQFFALWNVSFLQLATDPFAILVTWSLLLLLLAFQTKWTRSSQLPCPELNFAPASGGWSKERRVLPTSSPASGCVQTLLQQLFCAPLMALLFRLRQLAVLMLLPTTIRCTRLR